MNHWPPGLNCSVMNEVAPSMLPDAMQEAWLAMLEGRKPVIAIRALLRHEERHRTAKPDLDRIAVRYVRKRF